MRNLMIKFVAALSVLALSSLCALAQGGAAPSHVDSDAAEGLDLHAVAETFKDSDNLENFEHALNNPETGINNLDLNRDSHVDFIRVTEQIADNTHLIVLQAPLGEDDVQDVATIALEREGGENYNLQVQGDPSIYGADYYVVPANRDFGAWAVVRRLFHPNYRPYVSAYSYSVLPRWWTVRRPLLVSEYRNRTALFVGKRNFVSSRTFTVRTLNRVNYHPRASALVGRRPNAVRATTTTTVVKPRGVVQTRTETTVKQGGVKQTTTTIRRDAPPRRGRH